MIKSKNIISLLFIIFIIPTNITAEQDNILVSNCNNILSCSGIHLNTRSRNGWLRIIKNNNLQLYTTNKLTPNEITNISECIKKIDFDIYSELNRGVQK